MLQIAYVGTLLGTFIGALGAITGVLGGLATRAPDRYSGKLRTMLWADIVLGLLLTAVGAVMRLTARSEQVINLADIMWFVGSLFAGCLSIISAGHFTNKLLGRVLVLIMLFSAIAFSVFGVHSLSIHSQGQAIRELSWGATLLVLFAVRLFLPQPSEVPKPG